VDSHQHVVCQGKLPTQQIPPGKRNGGSHVNFPHYLKSSTSSQISFYVPYTVVLELGLQVPETGASFEVAMWYWISFIA
jgi:hypothetical protein